ELASALKARGLEEMRAVFGGPPPVAEVARRSGMFELVFGAVDGPDVEEWLSGEDKKSQQAPAGRQDLLTRRRDMGRRPLIRHHFGLPTLERTVAGIEEIARSGLVDVISIAPDQNAQEHFFHPERMDPAQDGAGGVPVRTADDFRALHKAAQAGNYPLLRCYSGTNDLVAFGEMLRSEERRVGKECRSRWSPYHQKKKGGRASGREHPETRPRRRPATRAPWMRRRRRYAGGRREGGYPVGTGIGREACGHRSGGPPALVFAAPPGPVGARRVALFVGVRRLGVCARLCLCGTSLGERGVRVSGRVAAASGAIVFFFFQAEDGIRDFHVTGVQTCALPI